MQYLRLIDIIRNIYQSVYDSANQEMLTEFTRSSSPDGQIVFLAANPDLR